MTIIVWEGWRVGVRIPKCFAATHSNDLTRLLAHNLPSKTFFEDHTPNHNKTLFTVVNQSTTATLIADITTDRGELPPIEVLPSEEGFSFIFL